MRTNSISRNRDRQKNKDVPPVLLFLLGLVILLLVGWVAFPDALYVERQQPIDFNHRVHAKIADNSCESCHAFRPDGSFTGIPGIETCRTCHGEAKGRGPEEERLVREYLDKNREIPWHVYASQPDSVFFSHAAHVRLADLACETCHGSTGQSASLRPYEENVLTGYSRDIWGQGMVLSADQYIIEANPEPAIRNMKMDDCVDCHLATNLKGTSVQTGKEGCFVCHK